MQIIHYLRTLPTRVIFATISLFVIFTFGVTTALGSGVLKRNAPLSIQGMFHGNTLASGRLTPNTAQLENLKGLVEVQDKEGQWEVAQPNQILSVGERVRTGQLSSVSLAFYDSSQAQLEADTELAILDINAESSSKLRTIVLFQESGDSLHKVSPNNTPGSRYEVQTPSGTGEARGTEFRVLVTTDLTARFFVIEGVVAVTNVQVTVLVNPGEFSLTFPAQPPQVPIPYLSQEGLVSQMGDIWLIAGQEFTVNAQTAIIGNIQVGDWVKVDAHQIENTTWVADAILLLRPSPLNHFSFNGTVEEINTGEWIINGQTIIISDSTILEADIQVGELVHVDGVIREGGVLEAVFIERLDPKAEKPFEFTGILQSMDPDPWKISEITVAVAENTILEPGLAVGELVNVSGQILPDNTWQASAIRHAKEQDRVFEFSGALESMDPWKVSGISFVTQEWTTIAADLKLGEIVLVKGEINTDGVWVADSIERVDTPNTSDLILIGPIFSMDPWVVSGIPINVTPDTVIEGEISVGMLVRVDIQVQADGSWTIIKIQPLPNLPGFSGCMEITAVVVNVQGDQIQLLNWPLLTLDTNVEVTGVMAPNAVVRMQICFTEQMTIQITYIVVVQEGDSELPVDSTGKVDVCHKPDKKGGHTLNIAAEALPAHLGHGDYIGPCR